MNNEEKILALLEKIDERQNRSDALLEKMDSRIEDLEKGQAAMQTEMRKDFEKVHADIGHLYENSDKNMKIIAEGLGHLNERYAQLDKVEKQADDHDNRIYALEQKVGNG